MGTDDVDFLRKKISDSGFSLPELTSGEGIDDHTGETRTWINQFFPSEISRGLFSFIIQHKTGVLPSINSYPKSSTIMRIILGLFLAWAHKTKPITPIYMDNFSNLFIELWF